MQKKIIINGRGGCGKSTTTSLLSKRLSEDNRVVVIDLDEGNLGLNKILGLEKPEKTLIDYFGGKEKIMAELQKAMMNGEESINILDEIAIDEFDSEYSTWNGNIGYIEVGKIEEPEEGCACPMGNLARDFINNIKIEENEILIIDTAAGIEHIGRGVLEGVDVLLTIVDGSNDAVLITNKINRLAKQAGKDHKVILNKIDEELVDLIKSKLDEDIEVIGRINYKKEIVEKNINGEAISLEGVGDEINKIISNINN